MQAPHKKKLSHEWKGPAKSSGPKNPLLAQAIAALDALKQWGPDKMGNRLEYRLDWSDSKNNADKLPLIVVTYGKPSEPDITRIKTQAVTPCLVIGHNSDNPKRPYRAYCILTTNPDKVATVQKNTPPDTVINQQWDLDAHEFALPIPHFIKWHMYIHPTYTHLANKLRQPK